MQQDNLTINLTFPTGWDKLDDHQLRYVFGLLFKNICSSGNNTMEKILHGINHSSRIFPFLRKVCAQRNIGHRDR